MLGIKYRLITKSVFSLPICDCGDCSMSKEQREIVKKSKSLWNDNQRLYSLNFGESRDWRSIVEKLVDGK